MSTSASPRCFALVPCAGSGARAGADLPKQYVHVAGRAVVAHTIDALRRVQSLANIAVVLAPDDAWFEHAVPDFAGWAWRIGGATRAATVAQGLAHLVQYGVRDDDWVLVHDAARCLVQPASVQALIDACLDDAVGGLLACPVADTLQREANGRAVAPVDRRGLWQAQTPQMFRVERLRRALAQAGTDVTDEATAMAAMGWAPRLVQGMPDNLKITYPSDFSLAARLLGGSP